MVTPLDAFGLVSSAISIASALQSWIEGAGTDPSASFRQSVNTKLDAIQNQLQTVITGLDYLAALVVWETFTSNLSKAKLDIDNAWSAANMDVFMAGSNPAASLPTFEPATVTSLVSALETYHNFIIGKEGSITAPNATDTPLLQSFLHMVYAMPPDQCPPTSPCEMAYHYWRTLVCEQLQALMMLALASAQGIVDKTTSSTISNWRTASSNDNYFRLQGTACQQVATSQVDGAASVETDETIVKFCSVSPYQQPLTSYETNLTTYDAFYLADITDSINSVPTGEVLVSWGFRVLPIPPSYLTGLPHGSGCLLIPVLYSGTYDPATGLVSPPSGQTGFTKTTFTENDARYQEACSPGNWLDSSCVIATGESANNNGILQAAVDYFSLDYDNGLRQRVYGRGGLLFGIDQFITTYWYAAYLGNVNTSEEQKNKTPPAITDGELLTGITFDYPPQATQSYQGNESYDSDGPPEDPDGDIFYRNYVRMFIRVRPASCTVNKDKHPNTVDITSGQWVSDSKGGIMPGNIVQYNQNPQPGDTMIKAGCVTTRCVGADLTVKPGCGGDAMTSGTPMPPLTGAGITIYKAADGQLVVAPLNIYAYHLNKFNS
jgi:hypothetical protein